MEEDKEDQQLRQETEEQQTRTTVRTSLLQEEQLHEKVVVLVYIEDGAVTEVDIKGTAKVIIHNYDEEEREPLYEPAIYERD